MKLKHLNNIWVLGMFVLLFATCAKKEDENAEVLSTTDAQAAVAYLGAKNSVILLRWEDPTAALKKLDQTRYQETMGNVLVSLTTYCPATKIDSEDCSKYLKAYYAKCVEDRFDVGSYDGACDDLIRFFDSRPSSSDEQLKRSASVEVQDDLLEMSKNIDATDNPDPLPADTSIKDSEGGKLWQEYQTGLKNECPSDIENQDPDLLPIDCQEFIKVYNGQCDVAVLPNPSEEEQGDCSLIAKDFNRFILKKAALVGGDTGASSDCHAGLAYFVTPKIVLHMRSASENCSSIVRANNFSGIELLGKENVNKQGSYFPLGVRDLAHGLFKEKSDWRWTLKELSAVKLQISEDKSGQTQIRAAAFIPFMAEYDHAYQLLYEKKGLVYQVAGVKNIGGDKLISPADGQGYQNILVADQQVKGSIYADIKSGSQDTAAIMALGFNLQSDDQRLPVYADYALAVILKTLESSTDEKIKSIAQDIVTAQCTLWKELKIPPVCQIGDIAEKYGCALETQSELKFQCNRVQPCAFDGARQEDIAACLRGEDFSRRPYATTLKAKSLVDQIRNWIDGSGVGQGQNASVAKSENVDPVQAVKEQQPEPQTIERKVEVPVFQDPPKRTAVQQPVPQEGCSIRNSASRSHHNPLVVYLLIFFSPWLLGILKNRGLQPVKAFRRKHD